MLLSVLFLSQILTMFRKVFLKKDLFNLFFKFFFLEFDIRVESCFLFVFLFIFVAVGIYYIGLCWEIYIFKFVLE